MSTKKKTVAQTNVDIRNSLESDVEAFLKKGNKIQQIPTGMSGQAAISGKKPTSATAATPAAATTPAAPAAAEKDKKDA